MTLFQYILAMLLTIVAPGKSVYSRVALPTCDETCQQTPTCSNPHKLTCKPPQFSQQLFDLHLKDLQARGIELNKAKAQAKLKSFTRVETYQEGLARYTVIAQAIADVAEESTQSVCKQSCSSETTTEGAKSCHQTCLKNAPWVGSKADLAFMIATVTNQESGYRADVHGGVGALGRGDCQWQFADGRKAAPNAKGAAPIPSTCRSVCLGQINIGNGTTPNGMKADDLVGIDYGSTKRCLTVVARYLSSARMLCTRWNKGNGDWARATFAVYGTGASCTAYQKKTISVGGKRVVQYAYKVKKADGKPGIEWGAFPPDNAINKTPLEAGWPAKRASIFHSYSKLHSKKALTLSQDVQKLLTSSDIDRAVKRLMNAPTAVHWMTPVGITLPSSGL